MTRRRSPEDGSRTRTGAGVSPGRRPGNWRPADTTLLLDSERWTYTAGDIIGKNLFFYAPRTTDRSALAALTTPFDVPLVINLYGSYARMRMALGCGSFEELADRVQRVIKPQPPTGFIEKMKMLPELAKIAGYAPKRVRGGLCHEAVHTNDADLLALPSAPRSRMRDNNAPRASPTSPTRSRSAASCSTCSSRGWTPRWPAPPCCTTWSRTPARRSRRWRSASGARYAAWSRA
jgi:hypothetical protein